jgi:cysteinyl-tRNA synthetase
MRSLCGYNSFPRVISALTPKGGAPIRTASSPIFLAGVLIPLPCALWHDVGDSESAYERMSTPRARRQRSFGRYEAEVVLRLYNTLTREKAEFKPIKPENVRMYVCGPTVYDFAHIGNARPVIVFDVLFRLLKHLYPGPGKASDGSCVEYVRNITDVDDKINARALRDFPGLPLNEAIARVTEKTANQFHADVKALGCLEPTVEPRATDNIQQMIDIIVPLIAKGHAYVAAGEVLFDTASMPDYGALSNRKLDEQHAGARVEVEAHKKNSGDFVLWKLSSPEEPGWESPWGRGRPGWHIECSAMSERYLGQTFDIHGGGLDLIFPHHENEIAQSRCAHGTSVMANVWMHNGFLQVEGEKMSKSLGNFITINELLETTKFGGRTWPGEVLRLAMLMTHYRQPIDFSVRTLEVAEKVLDNWYRVVGSAQPSDTSDFGSKVEMALGDDLNTHEALAVLHLAYDVARDREEQNASERFKHAANLLGFLELTGEEWKRRRVVSAQVDESAVGNLIAARLAARKAKDFKESDRIRDELAAMGIALKDTKNKETGEIETTWEVAR